jgi:hypothetical protein
MPRCALDVRAPLGLCLAGFSWRAARGAEVELGMAASLDPPGGQFPPESTDGTSPSSRSAVGEALPELGHRSAAADFQSAEAMAKMNGLSLEASPEVYSSWMSREGQVRVDLLHRNDCNVKMRTADGKLIWTREVRAARQRSITATSLWFHFVGVSRRRTKRCSASWWTTSWRLD